MLRYNINMESDIIDGIIYRITNNAPETPNFGKSYIGQARSYEHYLGRLSSHKNKNSNIPLRVDIAKYGFDNFISEYKQYTCSLMALNDLEVAAIVMWNSVFSNGYNKTSGGSAGWIASEETKAKMSKASKGRNLGKKHTPETRAKMSAAVKGYKRALGAKHTPEQNQRQSERQKGRGLGRKLSPETRAKVSAARKRQINIRKQEASEVCFN